MRYLIFNLLFIIYRLFRSFWYMFEQFSFFPPVAPQSVVNPNFFSRAPPMIPDPSFCSIFYADYYGAICESVTCRYRNFKKLTVVDFWAKIKNSNFTSYAETNYTIFFSVKNAVKWWVDCHRWRSRKKVHFWPRSGAPLAEKMKMAQTYIKMTVITCRLRISK